MRHADRDAAGAEEKCCKAEYYRTVTAAMKSSGHDGGYTVESAEIMDVVRKNMDNADPQTRERIRNEVYTMLGTM